MLHWKIRILENNITTNGLYFCCVFICTKWSTRTFCNILITLIYQFACMCFMLHVLILISTWVIIIPKFKSNRILPIYWWWRCPCLTFLKCTLIIRTISSIIIITLIKMPSVKACWNGISNTWLSITANLFPFCYCSNRLNEK